MALFGFKRKQKEQEQETLEAGLEKTRTGLFDKLSRAVAGKDTVDDDVLDDLEEVLVTSDVGVTTTVDVIRRIEARVAEDKYVSTAELQGLIRAEIANLLLQNAPERPADFDAPLPSTPHVVMVVGVNGVGKTTSIGKMAHRYKVAGKSVLLGAADTFRAAATEQLDVWAGRAGVPIIKQYQGADPAAVAFDTLAAAKSRDTDVVLIDTAGRLHNRVGLMDELAKVRRVMDRQVAGAPHEVLLVLDGSTGQNALRQAEAFTESVDVTGLVLTKLDGTAKGGIVIGISNEFQIPVKYIGVGEGIDDLQVFDRSAFVDALFGDGAQSAG
ncbi:signal recognition particle-docking protein FtsY [Rubrivirga sp. S365]|uniref:Signal recognition particle receptor FtsY n=1 Tax=Rubrivirga litoralis TaxID=3075598 RepID=A0ABU3BSS5_9BACT|nr:MULTISPECIES: signal recognition particle-docking protein FtsY [unclassified Rubrivirga]MDT0632318.1 signal recognition particle-docking protein FtsY [Rubrivirga sp. F394]MDT7856297.1 signal recognition particle-docking protein FtsY [Rubrivirga sp. S365]